MEPGIWMCKDDVNVRTRLEYGNRLVGVPSLDNIETGVTDHFRGIHSQQKFVFDDENDGPAARGSCHYAPLPTLSK